MREGGARVGREQCRCRVEKREEACIAVDFASFTFPPRRTVSQEAFTFKVKRSRSRLGQAQRLKRTRRVMSDAANPSTRNIMPRREGVPSPMDYRSGSGMTYAEQLRKASWNTEYDVPKIGQKSAAMQMPELRQHKGFKDGEHYLHPTKFTALAHSDHLSYAKCNPELGILWNGNPDLKKVHERLYLGSRVLQRVPRRSASNLLEMAADVAFQCVEPEDAVPLYNAAIKQTP
jgi:hypothetical protein